MKTYSEKFNMPSSSEEARKMRLQAECPHFESEQIHANPLKMDKFLIRCTECKKVLGSELTLSPENVLTISEILLD